MTRTGIDCGLGKTLQQEPNARGLNGREPWVGKACRLTIAGAGRETWVVGRRGAPEDSVRPRRSYGGIGRPLNLYSQGHET